VAVFRPGNAAVCPLACGLPMDLRELYDVTVVLQYRGADKSLARPTSRCILFDGENISFDASLVICIYEYI
jgi:hypothetical protein